MCEPTPGHFGTQGPIFVYMYVHVHIVIIRTALSDCRCPYFRVQKDSVHLCGLTSQGSVPSDALIYCQLESPPHILL